MTREPGADAVKKREQLEERGQRGNHKGCLNQRCLFTGAQAAYFTAGQNDCRGNHTHDSGYHMLQSQRNQLASRRDALV